MLCLKIIIIIVLVSKQMIVSWLLYLKLTNPGSTSPCLFLSTKHKGARERGVKFDTSNNITHTQLSPPFLLSFPFYRHHTFATILRHCLLYCTLWKKKNKRIIASGVTNKKVYCRYDAFVLIFCCFATLISWSEQPALEGCHLLWGKKKVRTHGSRLVLIRSTKAWEKYESHVGFLCPIFLFVTNVNHIAGWKWSFVDDD